MLLFDNKFAFIGDNHTYDSLKSVIDIDFLSSNIDIDNLNVDKSVEISDVVGGYNAAKSRLDLFAEKGFNDYSKLRSHPSEDASSQLSPYFHFGHISTILDVIS